MIQQWSSSDGVVLIFLGVGIAFIGWPSSLVFGIAAVTLGGTLIVAGTIQLVTERRAQIRHRQRGFEVEVKPISGVSPEQREREAHNG